MVLPYAHAGTGKLSVFHDATHWIMKGEEAQYNWQKVHAWLDQYLGDSR